MNRTFTLSALALQTALALACSPSSKEETGSSTAPLTVSQLVNYGSGSAPPPPPSLHPATMTTQVVATPGGFCNVDQKNLVSAWEARDYSSGTDFSYDMLWSVACTNGGTIMVPPTLLNALNGGGTPPEWTGDPNQDGGPMLWVGQPHLVQLGPPGWVALVGLVADGPNTSHGSGYSATAENIAVTLSTNGGQSWLANSAHLVLPTDGVHGGTSPPPVESVFVRDFDVAVAPWTNGFGTHDIFVVWTVDAGTFFVAARYDTTQVWTVDPFTTVSATPLHELSAVAGTHPVIGNFLFVMNPTTTSLVPGQCPGSFALASQSWNVTFSANTPIGSHWYPGRPISAGTTWPTCVGGNHDTLSSIYPNRARATLAYDAADGYVMAATTRRRAGDNTGSVDVRMSGFSWCVCGGTCNCAGGAPGGSQAADFADSKRDDHVPLNQVEDQFEPVLGTDPSTSYGVVAWYDTAELATHNVSSLHGQVQPMTSTSLPGNLKVYAPSPVYAFGTDLGLYNGVAAVGSNAFFVGFSDGVLWGQPPNGLGGVYTTMATP